MGMFGYYAWHSFINQVRKIFKTWVLIFIVACGLIGGAIGYFSATIADMAEEQHPEEVIVEEDPGPSWFEEQNIDGIQILELVVGGLVISSLLYLTLSADKNGSKVFLPADVNLLFPSPMKPQSVLMFRLATKMGTAVFMGVYMMIQIPNIMMLFDMSAWGAFALMLDFGFVFAVGSLLQIFWYLKFSQKPFWKSNLSRILYGLLAVVAAAFFLYWKSCSEVLLKSAITFFNAPITRWIPVWGWLKAFPLWASEGNLVASVISALLIIAFCIALFLVIQHTEADFYEDAMAKSEETAALLEQAQAEQAGRVGMRQRKKDRSEKLKRDEFHHGFGASVFFHKTMYNRFRFAHLGFFTKTMETYLVASVAAALFTRFFLESDTILVLVLGLSVLCFYRALGNPLEQDLKMGYFQMIPDGARQKLLYSVLGSTLCCLLDLLPGLIIGSLILQVNPLLVLAWIPVILSVDLFSTIVGSFIDLSVPISVGPMVKQFIQIFFIYFGLLPDIAIMAVGIVTDNTGIACIITTVVNLVLSYLFLVLSAVYLEPGGGKRVYQEEEIRGDQSEAKKQFSKMGLAIFIMLVVATVFQLGFSHLIPRFFPAYENSELVFWLITFVPIYAIAFPVTAYCLKRIPAEPIPKSSLPVGGIVSFFFISFMAMYLGNLIGVGVTTLMGFLTDTTPLSGIETYAMSTSNILKIVFLVILAPTIEECIFRKMLIDRMHPYGAWPAILTSAAMFGLFHGNFSQMFYAFFVGICFGFVYMRTGKIQYSACMHIAINFLGSVIAPAIVSNLNLDVEDTAQLASQGGAFAGFLAYMLFMIGSAIIGIFLLIANRRNLSFEPQSKQISKKGSFSCIWCNWGMFLFLLGCLAMVVLSFI